MATRKFQNLEPVLKNRVYIDDTAVVIGDVVLGDDCGVWPTAVIRGDVNTIRIGERTNIQDGSILHVTHVNQANPQGAALTIGNDVTIGHRVVLHGCHISDECLIGMGSLILDDVQIPKHVLIGANSLVPPGKILESGYLYLGSPVKKIRPLTDAEITFFRYSAEHYVKLKNIYLGLTQNDD
jgi:carbonic anhydrase/acetyltransferase-like protein (isoleucine patch superfamily)